jgi:hypothetical protein
MSSGGSSNQCVTFAGVVARQSAHPTTTNRKNASGPCVDVRQHRDYAFIPFQCGETRSVYFVPDQTLQYVSSNDFLTQKTADTAVCVVLISDSAGFTTIFSSITFRLVVSFLHVLLVLAANDAVLPIPDLSLQFKKSEFGSSEMHRHIRSLSANHSIASRTFSFVEGIICVNGRIIKTFLQSTKLGQDNPPSRQEA